MSQRLFFLHIPKTAGTALNELLEERYPADKILPPGLLAHGGTYIQPPSVKSELDEIRALDLVRGHFGNDVRTSAFEDYRSFTVLREPRARVISCFNDWATKSDENLQTAKGKAQELILYCREHTLADLLEHEDPFFQRFFRDAQARQLAGSLLEPAGDDTAERAVEALDRFDVVGVTEQLPLTLAVLWDTMAWGAAPQVPTRNTNRGSLRAEALDERTLRLIDEATRADRAVYQAAVARLGQDAAALLERRSAGPAPTPLTGWAPHRGAVTIEMSGPTPGAGWHVREGVGSPRVWRWTGPERASTFSLPLDAAREYTLKVYVVSELAPDIIDGLHLLAGETSLMLTRPGPEDGQTVIQTTIPQSLINPVSPTRLTLLVPRVMTHAEIQPETEDHRPKGLAITRITAEPAAS